jgi:hypothetical protein
MKDNGSKGDHVENPFDALVDFMDDARFDAAGVFDF